MAVQLKAYDYASLQTRHKQLDLLASGAGLLAIAQLMDSLTLSARIDKYFPQPKSNRGYRPSEVIRALILRQQQGSFHLDAILHLQQDEALCWISPGDHDWRLAKADWKPAANPGCLGSCQILAFFLLFLESPINY